MRVLLLTQWFDPEPTFKGVLFARELQHLGHQVEVVTGFPNYPGGTLYDGYRVRPYKRELIDNIVVHRLPLYPSHDSSRTRRMANYLTFAMSATIKLLTGRRPDVIYVYHPPGTVAIPAILTRLVRGIPYVVDVQDLWPDTLGATDMVNEGRLTRLIGWVMRETYALAAHVVVLSDGFREALIARGVPGDKVTTIFNWAPEHEIVLSDAADAPHQLGSSDRFNVVFAGAIGPAQQLDVVLDAAELLKDLDEVHFVLLGSGIDAQRLQQSAQDRQLNNVTFLPRRSPAEVGQVLAASDALLVHLRPDPLFEITVPSKTQTYLFAAKPVLMGVKGDAARLIKKSGSGICFEPGDARDLARCVRILNRLTPQERAAIGTSGRQYYDQYLSLGTGAKKFATILEAAARQRHAWERTKRVMDVLLAAVALTLFAIPSVCIAGLVRSRLGSPVFFQQVRPGRRGQPFTMIKFRTMTDEKDDEGRLLPDANRLTRLGIWLRKSSLDELPELWNVLRGDMSLVGPRPLLDKYLPWFSPEERRRLDVRPGITGLAQVRGRNLASWDERLALDVQYVSTLSPCRDLYIMFSTVTQVFRRAGVVSDPSSIMNDLDVERSSRVNGGS